MREHKVSVTGNNKEHYYTFLFDKESGRQSGREILKAAAIHPALKAELLLEILENFNDGKLVAIKRTIKDVIR